jgi:hypothetical protein
MLARPVTLPPGLLKLATIPLPTGSEAVPNTNGTCCVDFFCRDRGRWAYRHDDFDIVAQEIASELLKAARIPARPAIFEANARTFHPSALAKSLR